RKVVLVESVERLLEKTTRDAFSDLMTLAADDPGLRIILTCRDYSVEQVRASFLQPARINHTVVRVPPLDDTELSETEAANPTLAIPLRNLTLRNILRNPFFLDKALGIKWSAERPVPESEREFRALFWREIVRADHMVAAGMGRRREQALGEVAVRRARALSDYVVCNDVDADVIESLRRDSLIASPDNNPLLVATAHDVLEDWAILQWLQEQHLGETSFSALSAAIGAHPAVRRSYRRWVAELIERDALAADRLFQAAISDTNISVQFRDDTLVSLLKAPLAPEFLARHEAQLVANDRTILRRVIHLLRVACVKTPEWLAGLVQQGSILNVPDGSAWPAVLRLVHRYLATFTPKQRPLLLGLVEDAVRGVSWWAPDLEGAEFVAGIGHWLLDGLRGYGGEEPRKRVLQVIAKLPKADPGRFEAALRDHIEEDERRDPVAEDFQELIYAGIDGMPAARDLPDLIVAVGADYLLASEEDITEERRGAYRSLDIDLYFGIKEGLRHDSFPASAIRGPWAHLLRSHPGKALDFYVQVFNHSADWYAHSRLRDRLEPPWEVVLTFADGTTRKQWANPRLWGLYRGMSVGPYPLQSMLMALENWLLDTGKQSPELLDSILVDILRRSDSAALAAVVASAAIAYPHASGEALLVLLSVRDYIVMDRSRMVGEQQMSGMTAMFPTLRADEQVYEMERKQANALPHRRYDLEAAIANLQLGPLAARVQALLDAHLAALPPKEQQDEQDLMWRLAIHRMDFRQYTVSETPDTETHGADAKPGEPSRRYVRLDLKPPDADVQAMVDEGTARVATMNARLGVLMWGLQSFRGEAVKYDPSQWSARLAEAQAMDRETDNEDGARHGPGFVASVCIRDHWDEMAAAQRDWCIDVVCSEVLRHADDADSMERTQRNPMSSDRAAAFVLASLFGKPLTDAHMQRVREAFAAAMTHPVNEVRWYATWSIDEKVWGANRPLALRCVNAIATEPAIIDEARKAAEARPYRERRHVGEIMNKAAAEIRGRFWKEGAIAEDAHVTVHISDGFGAHAISRMLAILGRIPQDPLAIAAFRRASDTLVSWWKVGDDRNRRRERDFHTESDVSQRLQEFLLRTSADAAREVLAPVLGAVDRHSRELQSIMQGLTGIQDTNPNTVQYWLLWELFADTVKRAKWVAHLGDEHPDGTELLSAVFLTAFWKDNVR
ncbi:MAG: AAA family ATPase, partial [Candidatus Binataceae bacterium]